MTNTKWNFVAGSRERLSALELAQRVASANCPVLVIGPTGVVKDVLAEDVHRHSARDVLVSFAMLRRGWLWCDAYAGGFSARNGLEESR